MSSRLLALSLLATLSVSAVPARACVRIVSPAAIDAALLEARSAIAPETLTKVRGLRASLVERLNKRDYAGASRAEGEAMRLMNFSYHVNGPPTRGCQEGVWRRNQS